MEAELTTLIQTTMQSELLTIAIVAILIFAFKDFAANIASGVAFWFDRDFNEGDKVIIDGKHAVIVSIGLRQTKFQYQEDGKIAQFYKVS